MKSINPSTGEPIKDYPEHTLAECGAIVSNVFDSWQTWKERPVKDRANLLKNCAAVLRSHKAEYALLMTLEMGKLIGEAESEIEKSAWVCDYYAENGEAFLRDEVIATDASRSFVSFEPLGLILAVMPWNFPFWQVFRFAAPALMAGNGCLLKHASNVPGCAMAIEEIFRQAGFPTDLFRTLLIPATLVEHVISDDHIAAVTLTGSEMTGSAVAGICGKQLKKTVLELGGSDPFIVLKEADIGKAAKTAVTARMINAGQSCIAAKRFMVEKDVYDTFICHVTDYLTALKAGDPSSPGTTLAPLARPDLADDLHRQVTESIHMGANLILGGHRTDRPGNYYEPTLLTNVTPDMPVFAEETFGPVMAVMMVQDEQHAITIANGHKYGLGGSLWTKDIEKGIHMAHRIESGAVFINGMTKSDPRLPFGGIKKSGYGRELSHFGIREFVNIKTIWIA